MSVSPDAGIFAIDPNVKEMYTTVHVGNVTSRTAFIKGGYREAMTYKDTMRERNTTVLKVRAGLRGVFARRTTPPPCRENSLTSSLFSCS